MATSIASGLSKRGEHIRVMPNPPLSAAHFKCVANAYDPVKNPKGMVNLGSSENHLCYDLISEKFKDPKMHCIEPWMMQYCNTRGIIQLRQAIGDYLTMKNKTSTPVKPENLSVCNGVETLIAALMTVLCDPGDGFLSPAPCYGGIRGGISNDLKRIGNVKPILVQLGSQVNFDAGEKQPFQLTVDKFEKALQKATDEGINVRGLILINPNNPLGEIYSRELLMELLNFAHRHSLHVVVDEIYMGTIFKSDAVHTSIVNIDNLPDPQRTHMLWGVSKDFGMAGFRCGVCHSFNQHLHQALEYLGYFYAIPANVQHQLTEFLSDKEWLNNVFFPTNHQRLRETYQCMSDGLTKLGIAHLHRSAGLFIWADFRLYLRSQTYEAEMDLYNKFLSGGVNISPGHNFDCAEFGWFRIVFAHPTHELLIAIERIGKVLDEIKSEICGDSLELNLVGPDQPVLGAASHEDNTQKKEDCLEDLLTGLQHQIKTSNWLKDNTAEKWINENPMLYQEYKEAANKH